MTASLWVCGRVWTLDMESRTLRTTMHKIRLHHTCVIFMTLHPMSYTQYVVFTFLHVFLPSFTPSLRHHSDTNVSVLLSIYSHFLFSFYPRFTPKHDRLLKTCRIVFLLFLTVLPSNNIRISVGFFPSVLQCYISIKTNASHYSCPVSWEIFSSFRFFWSLSALLLPGCKSG